MPNTSIQTRDISTQTDPLVARSAPYQQAFRPTPRQPQLLPSESHAVRPSPVCSRKTEVQDVISKLILSSASDIQTAPNNKIPLMFLCAGGPEKFKDLLRNDIKNIVFSTPSITRQRLAFTCGLSSRLGQCSPHTQLAPDLVQFICDKITLKDRVINNPDVADLIERGNSIRPPPKN